MLVCPHAALRLSLPLYLPHSPSLSLLLLLRDLVNSQPNVARQSVWEGREEGEGERSLISIVFNYADNY